MSKDKKVTTSGGNVFADLGFAYPEEELLKAKLVRELRGDHQTSEAYPSQGR
jgi:hypothetical protein